MATPPPKPLSLPLGISPIGTDPDPTHSLRDGRFPRGRGEGLGVTSMRPLGALAGGAIGALITVAAAQAADPPTKLRFDVMPYSGAKLGDANDHALPGAMVEIGPGREPTKQDQVTDKLQSMGVRDGTEFGNAGRW